LGQILAGSLFGARFWDFRGCWAGYYTASMGMSRDGRFGPNPGRGVNRIQMEYMQDALKAKYEIRSLILVDFNGCITNDDSDLLMYENWILWILEP